MKCETTNTVLTFVLGALTLLSVIFALQTIFRTREMRSLQMAIPEKNYMMTVQLLYNDATEYSKTHPEMNRFLQPIQPAKPSCGPLRSPAQPWNWRRLRGKAVTTFTKEFFLLQARKPGVAYLLLDAKVPEEREMLQEILQVLDRHMPGKIPNVAKIQTGKLLFFYPWSSDA